MMKLGFIGIGRIACAVIKGLCTSNIENTTINLSPRNDINSNYLAKTFFNVNRLENNQFVLDNSDIIFISVPANSSKEILNNLTFKETHTIISFIPFLIFSELAEAVKPASKICLQKLLIMQSARRPVGADSSGKNHTPTAPISNATATA